MGEKIIDPVLRNFFDSLKAKDAKPVTKPSEPKEKTLHKDEPVKVPKKEKTRIESISVEAKRAIYGLPLNDQYDVEGEFKKGKLYRHLLVSKKAEDYNRVEDTAKLFAEKVGDCKMNPTIHKSETEIRSKIYPGIESTANPDLDVKGVGFVDVKSPKDTGNVVRNAVHASHSQGSIACITDHRMNVTRKEMDSLTSAVFRDNNYKHDTLYWVVKGKLYEYKRPKE